MISKVLIADDSLTIQKVINITLANSGYELVECLNEEELIKKVESNQFDLVLLDFNLSDSKSGYELSKLIKSKQPKSSIIVMLGTFDSVDEGQFAACGINDKIVKPFESSKFIKKCKDVLEGSLDDSDFSSHSNLESTNLNQENEYSDEFSTDLNLDAWTMESPISKMSNDQVESENSLDDLDDFGSEEQTQNLDPLSSEMEGWGFNSGSNIEETFDKSFPPAIEEKEHNILERLESSSNFNIDDEYIQDSDETDPAINLSNIMTQSIESEIEDELTPEDFWAVDEVVDFEAVEKESINDNNVEEVTADLTESVTQFRQQNNPEIHFSNEEAASSANVVIDEAAILEKLKSSIRPMIEEMVREYCSKQAERVAWEIIPDLAENLIREEIRTLSDSVKH